MTAEVNALTESLAESVNRIRQCGIEGNPWLLERLRDLDSKLETVADDAEREVEARS